MLLPAWHRERIAHGGNSHRDFLSRIQAGLTGPQCVDHTPDSIRWGLMASSKNCSVAMLEIITCACLVSIPDSIRVWMLHLKNAFLCLPVRFYQALSANN